MDDYLERYQALRTLLDAVVRAAPADGANTPLAAARDYLHEHCHACGNFLETAYEADDQRLCATCYARFLGSHVQPDPQSIAQWLATCVPDLELRAQLVTFFATAPDRELYRFNANGLADRLGLPRRTLLAALAPLVVNGLLELNWELYCLWCFHQQPAFESLQAATSRQTCKNCHLTYDAPLDEEITITFTLRHTVRALGAHADDRVWRQHVNERCGVVTAHELLTIQTFRDLFVNEPLPTHESFTVGRMTLLFTDLGGSTALYARQGDPRAYALVREHFGVLFAIVAEAGGAVVKTIGDAIMAVFPLSDQGLAAAWQAQRAIAAFNRERQLNDDEALQLKVGLHAGPCLAVTLNDRLDYFGTTVNVAARLQKLAAPGELVFSAEVYQGLKNLALLPESLAAEQVSLRGLSERPLTIYRAVPADGVAG